MKDKNTSLLSSCRDSIIINYANYVCNEKHAYNLLACVRLFSPCAYLLAWARFILLSSFFYVGVNLADCKSAWGRSFRAA